MQEHVVLYLTRFFVQSWRWLCVPHWRFAQRVLRGICAAPFFLSQLVPALPAALAVAASLVALVGALVPGARKFFAHIEHSAKCLRVELVGRRMTL